MQKHFLQTLIGCALPLSWSTTFVISHIYYLLGVLSSLRRERNLCYLTYIFIIVYFPTPKDASIFGLHRVNVGVKSFVLVAIELLVSEFTFRCSLGYKVFVAKSVFWRQRVPSYSLLHCVRTLYQRGMDT